MVFAPKNKIEYPKINPEEFSNTLLINDYTYFILLEKDDKSLNWRQEEKFKVNLAEWLINGRKGAYQYKAKIVGFIFENIISFWGWMLNTFKTVSFFIKLISKNNI